MQYEITKTILPKWECSQELTCYCEHYYGIFHDRYCLIFFKLRLEDLILS